METRESGRPEEHVVCAGTQSRSFEDHYREDVTWARRLGFLLVGNVETADDLVQEAFAALQPRLGQVENPRAYLRVTLVNLAFRHRQREHARAYGHLPYAEAVEETTATVDIMDVVNRLPHRQRAVIVLRYYEDLQEAEIAHALGCRPGTVKSLAARALKRLREEITE